MKTLREILDPLLEHVSGVGLSRLFKIEEALRAWAKAYGEQVREDAAKTIEAWQSTWILEAHSQPSELIRAMKLPEPV